MGMRPQKNKDAFELERPVSDEFARVFDAYEGEINRLYQDDAFRRAYEALDVESFTNRFDDMIMHVSSYNAYHRRERRLWAVKIGTGAVDKRMEARLREMTPEGRRNFTEGFEDAAALHAMLEQAGFGPVIEEHLPSFTRCLAEPADPLADLVQASAREFGCTREMFEEFRAAFAVEDRNIVAAAGGFHGLRELSQRGVDAQLELMQATEEEGLSYIRGRCGPPAWAIAASKLLGTVGIAVSAWALVVIILVFVAILVAICLASKSGSSIRKQCEKLKVKIPVLRW